MITEEQVQEIITKANAYLEIANNFADKSEEFQEYLDTYDENEFHALLDKYPELVEIGDKLEEFGERIGM